jgi:hypothetical protein
VWLLALVAVDHRAPPAPLAPRVGGSLRCCRACACSLVGLPPLKLSHECISLSPSHTYQSCRERQRDTHTYAHSRPGPLCFPHPWMPALSPTLTRCCCRCCLFSDIDEALGVSTLDKLRGKLGVASAMVGFTYSVSAGVRFVVRLLGRCDAESKRVTNAVRPGGGGAWRSEVVAMCACECVR